MELIRTLLYDFTLNKKKMEKRYFAFFFVSNLIPKHQIRAKMRDSDFTSPFCQIKKNKKKKCYFAFMSNLGAKRQIRAKMRDSNFISPFC